MTPRALLAILEPLQLAAVYPGRRTIREVIMRLERGERVELDEVRAVVEWHARRGLRNEREAFRLVGEQLAAVVR